MSVEAWKRGIPKEAKESKFALFLWGGQEKVDRRKVILEELSSNPIFDKFNTVVPSLARKDAWTRCALQSRELIRLKLEKKWPHRTFMDAIRMTDWMLPVQPQFRIFMSNLERQMSDEQKAIWIPKTERFEIFGSYCQTELGHGSNVRGIETTATFDELTDEFVINSPTISSSKYWIGATGVWATHGIVVARLIIKGQDHGNHLFLTQLRNLDTQALMPGVQIYEQGPKAFQAMVGTDNGVLRFFHVRIPRSQMLARNAQILRDGTYIKPQNEKHSYGSMVTVRALMAEITGQDLLRAVVTAYHYTTFRKQFKQDSNQNEETTVFNYASVRYRLLPLLAQATALIIVGQNIKRSYDDYTTTMISTGDTSQLEDMHLQTVGAKVYSTEVTGKGVETCRIACGGHGFSAYSGFGRMYAHAINGVTYEGDNYVIGQQVPRAILKHYRNGTEGKLSSISYLSLLRRTTPVEMPKIETPEDWFRKETQRWALETRLATMVKQHIEDTDAGIDTSYTSHALTMAHSDFGYWKGMWDVMDLLEEKKESYLEPMRALNQVFALSILHNPHQPSLAQALPLPSAHFQLLRRAFATAIKNLGDNHVRSIIDAYGLTEYEMDSALARADQTPYEALYESASKSEMTGKGMEHLWGMMVDTRRIWRRVEEKEKEGKAKL